MKQESLNLLQKNIDILSQKYDLAIKSDNFGEALNIMKNIDALTRQLDFIGQKVTITTNDTYKNPWYDVLKFFIETGQPQLIRLDYTSLDAEKKHRGTGKTTALLQLSNDYNIPIVFTGNDSIRITQDLKDRAKNLGLTTTVIEYKRGLRFSQDIILIDEGTRLCDLPDNKIIIGFTK